MQAAHVPWSNIGNRGLYVVFFIVIHHYVMGIPTDTIFIPSGYD